MRYYNIVITNPTTGANVMPKSLSGAGLTSITSLLPNGQVNTAALNVELDIPVAPYHMPMGQSLVRIWGLGVEAIGSAFNLVGNNIAVYGGMSKGLPLANPAQARLLIQGTIKQAFGNWVGADQTVDLIVMPSTGTADKPLNHSINWQAGTPLATALSSSLQTAYPNAKLNISLNSRLVLNHNEYAFYGTLGQLASWANDMGDMIIKDTGYPGISIGYDGVTLTVSDQTTPSTATTINAYDLIGQPTWINPGVIQAKFVMRGDLDISGLIVMPQTIVTNSQQAMTNFTGNNQMSFSGNYVVQSIHHYGNFRQSDALSWNTTVEMYPQPKAVSNG